MSRNLHGPAVMGAQVPRAPVPAVGTAGSVRACGTQGKQQALAAWLQAGNVPLGWFWAA